MELGISDKVALVMGASKGLGKGVALNLAQEGAKVAILSREKSNIERAAKEIESKTQGIVLPIQCDVTKKESVDKAVKEVVDRFGTIHLLFANSGGPPSGGFFDFIPDDYLKAIHLNLMSTIYATYAVVPYMMKNEYGRIVASTSISVKQPLNNLILSNVSRAGVVTFIKSVSTALASYNITANVVAPGYTATERIEDLLEAIIEKEKISKEEALESFIKDIPLKRIAEISEFADVVTFLLSERASYVTGIVLPIDGGFIKGI